MRRPDDGLFYSVLKGKNHHLLGGFDLVGTSNIVLHVNNIEYTPRSFKLKHIVNYFMIIFQLFLSFLIS